jgi:hypothetical protein
MYKLTLITVAVTTSAGGAFSTTIAGAVGRLLQYRYVPDGSSPLDTGADIDLTGATTGFVYINQDNIGTSAFQKLPRYAPHDEAGAASLYAAGGEPVEGFMHCSGEMLTFAVANGGNALRGTFYFWFG